MPLDVVSNLVTDEAKRILKDGGDLFMNGNKTN